MSAYDLFVDPVKKINQKQINIWHTDLNINDGDDDPSEKDAKKKKKKKIETTFPVCFSSFIALSPYDVSACRFCVFS
jgi:hypothetical protein